MPRTPAKRPKTRPTPAPGTPTESLPAALAKRAKAARAAKLQRLATRARAAVAHIRECQTDVAANMVDIGLALVELKAEGMAEALGRASFVEVCTLDLKMSLSSAQKLIAIATRVPRELATRIGADRAAALLELTDATPEDDVPEEVLHTKLKLPSGHTLDVAEATTAEMREAAKEIRAARPGATTKRSRGFSASPEDKAVYASLVARIKKHKNAPDLRASLIATRDKKGPRVRLEVRMSDLGALGLALSAAAKKK